MKIRIWKLGNAEKGTYPSSGTANKLAQILETFPEEFDRYGNKIDIRNLIWGPDISVEQLDTEKGQIKITTAYPVPQQVIDELRQMSVEITMEEI